MRKGCWGHYGLKAITVWEQGHRRLKDGLAEMKRVFNELKHDERTVFITEVSKFVAEGAFDNFRYSLSRANWLNKGERADLKAGRPHLKRRRATGVRLVPCDSKRTPMRWSSSQVRRTSTRIRLPGLGSVKLRHELPEACRRRLRSTCLRSVCRAPARRTRCAP